MKRLHKILTKPTRVADVADIDDSVYEDKWLLKADKIQVKRMRRFKQQLPA